MNWERSNKVKIIGVVAAMIVSILVTIAGYLAVAYVVIHFIRKYW